MLPPSSITLLGKGVHLHWAQHLPMIKCENFDNPKRATCMFQSHCSVQVALCSETLVWWDSFNVQWDSLCMIQSSNKLTQSVIISKIAWSFNEDGHHTWQPKPWFSWLQKVLTAWMSYLTIWNHAKHLLLWIWRKLKNSSCTKPWNSITCMLAQQDDWLLQGPANRISAVRRVWSLWFQEFQEFQQFQETTAHFKSISRDSKRQQAFQEFQEHVSRGRILKCGFWNSFEIRVIAHHGNSTKLRRRSFKGFKSFKRQQHISTAFQETARDSKSFKRFKSTFQEGLTMHDWMHVYRMLLHWAQMNLSLQPTPNDIILAVFAKETN